MSFSPSLSLVRLQELKLWQGSYENLLQKSTASSRSPGSETLDGISPLNCPSPSEDPKDWDKKAISPAKPFEQLLEEKLAEDRPGEVNDKPKRPFLRKGEGLARFKMGSTQKNKVIALKKPLRGSTKHTHQANDLGHKKGILKCPKRHLDIDLSPLTVPDFIKPRGTWRKVFEHEDVENYEEFRKSLEPGEVRDGTSDTRREHFESLNREVIDKISNYCPSNSRFVSNAIPASITETSILSVDDIPPGENTLYEQKQARELRNFEALEKKVENSSFCSTNTSVVKLLVSTPQKKQELPNVVFTNGCETDNELRLQEIVEKTELLQQFLINLRTMGEHQKIDKSTSADTSYSEENTRWSTRSPSIADCETTCDTWKKIDIGVNTSFEYCNPDETVRNLEPCGYCESLRSRLSDTKLRLGERSDEVSKLKLDLKEWEKRCRRLQEDLKSREDKLEKLETELDVDKKKFAKERAFFETYVKEAQNRPSKKEREEITQLKQELADTKELLKLKDTKTGATQARLRTQIKQQEKEIAELKVTVEKLQKDNAKLNASQKYSRRPQEVKMLHEINKNLSKLTEETFRKQVVSKSGHGDAASTKENELNSKENKKKTPKSKSDTNTVWETTSGSDAQLIEKQYAQVFGSPRNDTSSASVEKTEKTLPDGSIEVLYSNGNVKTVSADGQIIKVKYFNGDLKETDLKQKIIRYHYAAADSWHIQYSDGTEVMEYPDGQKCKKTSDGKTEVSYPDGSIRIINTDGTEEQQFPDGRKTLKNLQGEYIILLPNGQREIHTTEYKRREYPDGTIRTLHKDGSVETVYSNGRIRLKDSNGVLLMDTQPS